MTTQDPSPSLTDAEVEAAAKALVDLVMVGRDVGGGPSFGDMARAALNAAAQARRDADAYRAGFDRSDTNLCGGMGGDE